MGLVVAEVGNVIVGIAATVTGLYPSTFEALNVCSDVEGVILNDWIVGEELETLTTNSAKLVTS